jgi:hypothetical protein
MSEGGISRDLQAEKASAAAPTSSKVISIEQSECCGLGVGHRAIVFGRRLRMFCI